MNEIKDQTIYRYSKFFLYYLIGLYYYSGDIFLNLAESFTVYI